MKEQGKFARNARNTFRLVTIVSSLFFGGPGDVLAQSGDIKPYAQGCTIRPTVVYKRSDGIEGFSPVNGSVDKSVIPKNTQVGIYFVGPQLGEKIDNDGVLDYTISLGSSPSPYDNQIISSQDVEVGVCDGGENQTKNLHKDNNDSLGDYFVDGTTYALASAILGGDNSSIDVLDQKFYPSQKLTDNFRSSYRELSSEGWQAIKSGGNNGSMIVAYNEGSDQFLKLQKNYFNGHDGTVMKSLDKEIKGLRISMGEGAVSDVIRTGQDGYIIMENFGTSLEFLIKNGKLSKFEILRIIEKAADEVNRIAKEGGIVSNDLNIGNIVIDKAGGVKIIDFSSAKIINLSAASSSDQGFLYARSFRRLIGSLKKSGINMSFEDIIGMRGTSSETLQAVSRELGFDIKLVEKPNITSNRWWNLFNLKPSVSKYLKIGGSLIPLAVSVHDVVQIYKEVNQLNDYYSIGVNLQNTPDYQLYDDDSNSISSISRMMQMHSDFNGFIGVKSISLDNVLNHANDYKQIIIQNALTSGYYPMNTNVNGYQPIKTGIFAQKGRNGKVEFYVNDHLMSYGDKVVIPYYDIIDGTPYIIFKFFVFKDSLLEANGKPIMIPIQ